LPILVGPNECFLRFGFCARKLISVVHIVCIVMYNSMLFGFFTFEENLKSGFQLFSILKKKTHAQTKQPIIIEFSN